MSARESFRPIGRAERIHLLDVLRGFAIGGIILVNIQVISGLIFLSPAQVAATGATQADQIGQLLVHVFVDEKFYSLFSLLFGIGFSIQMSRSAERGTTFASFFRRRLWILTAIGLTHVVFIWFGDILVLYALMGFVLIGFRNRSDRTVLRLAVALYASPILFYSLFLAIQMPDPFEIARGAGTEEFSPVGTMMTSFRAGGYVSVLLGNVIGYAGVWMRYVFYLRIPKVLGMFLLGVWIHRKGILQDIETHRSLITKTAAWGLTVGLLTNIIVAVLIERQVYLPASPLGLAQTAAAALGVPALALGYAASLALLFQRPRWRDALMLLAPAGRMALTTYLSQSIAGVVIFYGIGFGLFGRTRPLAVLAIGLAIFTVQVVLSRWWLDRFICGPSEWLWRRLTYQQSMPLRRS